MAKNKKFVVKGPHRVRETAPGETVSLDPTSPEAVRLLARGQIADAPSGRQSAGGASTEDAPASEPEE